MAIRRVIDPRSGWTRYGSGSPVDPGSYLILNVNRPADNMKRGLGLIAAKDPEGRFCWLAPDEPWVHRLMSGGIIQANPRLIEPDWSVIGIDPTRLRPWQKAELTMAWSHLAQDPTFRRGYVVSLGGGKTLVGLMLGQLVDQFAVVAPRYVHHTWISEARKWGFREPLVTTYESAYKLRSVPGVICDEVHALKNPDTQRHARIEELVRDAEIVAGFTGTPNAGGGPPDWRWLRCVSGPVVPRNRSQWQYLWGLDTKVEEVKPGVKAYVTETWDLDKIAGFVRPYVTTVNTSDLLAHLPEIEYRRLVVNKPADYDLIRSGAGSTRSKAKIRAQVQQCTDGFIYDDAERPVPLNTDKIRAIGEFVEGLGEPVVIYAAFRASVQALAQALGSHRPAVIEGDTGDVGGQIERFTGGLTDVMIANARYSAGMNLQDRCRVMVFMSVSTNPNDRVQAVGRIYRPGQTRGCIVVDVVADQTQDDRRIELVMGHVGASEAQVNALLEAEL